MRVLIRQCPCRAPSPPLRPQRLSPRNVTQSCHLHLGRAPALEHTSHTYYTEVLRNPLPPPRMAECARALAKTKADNLKNSPRRCVNPFSLSKLSHAFTGKYCTSSVSMQSRAERAASFACKCGLDPQTVNYVVFLTALATVHTQLRVQQTRALTSTTKQADP
jgi:hypothetical protein